MMEQNTAFGDLLKDIIIKNSILDIKREDISDSTDIFNELGFDSVQIIGLITDLETELGIFLEDGYLSADKLSSFKRLKEYIELRA